MEVAFVHQSDPGAGLSELHRLLDLAPVARERPAGIPVGTDDQVIHLAADSRNHGASKTRDGLDQLLAGESRRLACEAEPHACELDLGTGCAETEHRRLHEREALTASMARGLPRELREKSQQKFVFRGIDPPIRQNACDERGHLVVWPALPKMLMGIQPLTQLAEFLDLDPSVG